MPVPNTFANATATIPLSQLDANFATTITLGNTAIQLGNTVTTLNNMTLDNVNISSGSVTITNANVTTANVTNFISSNVSITGGTANLTTANVTNIASSNAVITGGSLDNVTIGSATAAAANVTNLTVNGNTTLGDANTDTILMTAAPSIGGAGLGMGFGFRNRIINGGMVIDQRNAGASVTPANGAHTLDRWASYLTQTSKYSVQQNAGSVTPPTGFSNYLGVTSLSSYSVLTGDTFFQYQMIEGFNFADMAWGTANAATVTLSFWVRSSLTGTFGGALLNSAANRSYPFSYTVSSANTWEQKTVSIAGDTSGTWIGATNGIGLIVRFGLGSGSTFSGTAGAWAAGNIVQPTGSVSVVGTNGATFYITGVQLEKGSTATSFDYRPYGTELALCQRYYYRFGGETVGYYFVLQAYSTSAVAGRLFDFPVTMRASPTVALSGSLSPLNATGVKQTALSGITFTSTTKSCFVGGSGSSSGLVAGDASITELGTTSYIDASSEL